MRIVVTGSSGQLGSFILDRTIERHEVVGLDLFPPKFAPHRGVWRQGDVRDAKLIRELLRGSDVVVHCAAQISVEESMADPLTDMDVNVRGTVELLQAAREQKVRRFVFVSSAAVYGDPIKVPIPESHPLAPLSFYGTSKVCAEQYVRTFGASLGLQTIVVRPFNFYSKRADPTNPYSGVIARFVKWARAGEPLLIQGDGEQTRDFIHASDVARMVVAACESDLSGAVLNCGSGKGTTVNELASIIVRASGRASRVEHVAPRLGDIKHSVADVSVARKSLGFKPELGLEDGLKTLFD